MLLEKLSARSFFQITGLCFGLAFVFIIPPFEVPDEPDHFERIFHLAEGHFFGIQNDQRLGGQIPESVATLVSVYPRMADDILNKQTTSKFEKANSIALNPSVKKFQDFPNTGLYPLTVYLPQIIVAKVGLILKIKPLYILYLARAGTLLFWIFLISTAIQILPVRRWELAFLALLPSSLFINATVSGDVVTNGISFLVIAFCYRMLVLEKVNISFTQMSWLTLGVVLLALNKFIYAPILLLSFLFPKTAFAKEKFRNQFAIGLTITAVLVVAIWNLKTSELFIPKDQYNPLYQGSITLNEGVHPKEQFLFILKNPIQYATILCRSFLETAPATTAHYFGKFGWEKNYLPSWTIGLLLLTTIFLFIQRAPMRLSKRAKIACLAIAFVMTIGLATTLYMMWNPVGNQRAWGLSGRYFIPIMPLVWLGLLETDKIRFKFKKELIVVVTLLALTTGLIAAYQRYY